MTTTEFSIPVLFDITAGSRAEAAAALAAALDICSRVTAERAALGQPTLAGLFSQHAADVALDAWRLPEPQDKAADGNDRDAMHLVSQEATAPPVPPASLVDAVSLEVDLAAMLAWESTARGEVEVMAEEAERSGDHTRCDERTADLAAEAWEHLSALLAACAAAIVESTVCDGCGAEPGEACRWGCLSQVA